MIEVSHAKKLLLENPVRLGAEPVPLKDAFGRTVGEDIIAKYDHPLFDQSAVDGYALRHEDVGDPLECIDEAAAGSPAEKAIGAGQCARIFTGGLLPKGADTVVMQEFTQRDGLLVRVQDPGLKPGGNVRYCGEQVAEGSLAMRSGTMIDAAAIGFLASIGVQELMVSKQPKVGLVVSGSEFQDVGKSLEPGKIFGSNGAMLQASLRSSGISADYKRVNDEHVALREAFQNSMEANHITIITGGVSVGDHDLTRPVLEELGCDIVFHGVAQKPGKPMLFARKGTKYIFGLPGNPRAAFIGFYEYVLPIVHTLLGRTEIFMRSVHLPLAHDYTKRGQRAEFLAGKIVGDKVEVLKGQNSHMLMSLVGADGLIYLPIDKDKVPLDQMVELHLLP